MKKFLITITLLIISNNIISAQYITLDQIEKSIGTSYKNIETLLVDNQFEYAGFDEKYQALTYRYSNSKVNTMKEGKRFCIIYKDGENTKMISYVTSAKEEFFDWKKMMKTKEYVQEKVENFETSRKEISFNKTYGIEIKTEQIESADKKETLNKYTFNIAKF